MNLLSKLFLVPLFVISVPSHSTSATTPRNHDTPAHDEEEVIPNNKETLVKVLSKSNLSLGGSMSFIKILRNQREICLNSKYFLTNNNAAQVNGRIQQAINDPDIFVTTREDVDSSSTTLLSSKLTGKETGGAYSSLGCSGKSLSFTIDNVENNCSYCWDGCFKKFTDGSPAHTNIKSFRIPNGVVAIMFTACIGNFGYADPGYKGILEPGCHNVENISALVFAEESSTTLGKYDILGNLNDDNNEPVGYFEKELDTEHWYYGPSGISNAEGTSWYQYIFELLDPNQPRMTFQVGNGGTWLTPTQSEWKPGDPCRCSPLDWPATGDGEFCHKPDLTKCTNGCCGINGCAGLLQTMEGGAGYWLGKLPTSRVKWTIGSTTACYKYWSNSPLEVGNSDNLECDSLGVIAVSNRLLYPPDGIGFTTNGMFGHAWINTPIGKVKPNDTRRMLTLIVDTKNFKGPVAYMLPEYYGTQSKWTDQNGTKHPNETFANRGINTGGAAFEWSTVPVYGYQGANGNRIIRIPKMQFPFNDIGPRTVLMSGGKSYTSKNDLYSPLNDALSGKIPLDESKILTLNQGYIHPCDGLNSELLLGFELKPLDCGGRVLHRTEADGMCSAYIKWQVTSPSLNCNSSQCKLREAYIVQTQSLTKKNGQFIYNSGKINPLKNVPTRLEGDDVFYPHEFFLNYDRRKPLNLCGANPARMQLFCRKANTGDWIAWRWYKFSDQPGFRRLNLTKKEKMYLQMRITRLHKYMHAKSPKNNWLKTPLSMGNLVTIDPKLLITPPWELRFGYVPIVVYQGMTKPGFCAQL